MARLWLFSAAALLLCAAASATLVNVDVKRVIDVATTVAISRTTVTLRNDGDAAVESFHLAVHRADLAGLGDLWVTPSDDKERKALPMQPATDVPGLASCCRGYEVRLAQPLAAGASVTLDVRMDVASVIEAVPPQIERFQSQYMVYSGNAHYYSPYRTERAETNLALGSPEVTSLVAPNPVDRSGKRLKLGPYSDVAPLSHEQLRVRFRNDRGILVAERAAKHVHVSHWGGMAVSETYEVRNAAARHVGEWSRVDHTGGSGMMGISAGSRYPTAIDDVWANLPADATRVEYRDLVGNVTTSRLRKATKSKRAIQLRFRYPLMGGWRNHFWVSYDLALSAHAKSSGTRHVLSVPLMPSVNADVFCEQLEAAVSLPEWASDIEVETHPSLGRRLSVEHDKVRSTMTVFGRPVVRVRAERVRSQSKHVNRLVVRYSYNPLLLWVTPLIAVSWILGLFLVGIGCARLGVGAAAEETGGAKVKAL